MEKVVPVNLTSIEQYLEKHSLSPNQGGYNPHPAIGTYYSPYFYSFTVTSDILDYFPSGNLVEQVERIIYGPTFIDQIRGT